jgi:starch synthase
VDTVTPVGDPARPGTGFVFSDYTPEAFLKAIYRALDAYAHPDQWQRIMLNAMDQDFSWKVSAKAYLELYKSLV